MKYYTRADPGGTGGTDPPLNNHKNIGSPSNIMRGSRNFCQGGGGGGPGQSGKKALTTLFFFVCLLFFLVLSLFYSSQMINFKEIYHFSRFQRGSNIFQGGGVQIFPGGGPIAYSL